MNKPLYIITFIIALCCKSKAQTNLVPNGSFELYDTCPSNLGQVTNYVKDWFDPTYTSSDYFNSCANNFITGIPNNFYGNKTPFDGKAMLGFVTYNSSLLNYREYISVNLKAPINPSKTYCISFYISLSGSSKYATNNIGLLAISDTSNFYNFTSSNITIKPSVNTEKTFRDTLKWEKIEFELTNLKTNSYIIIGNFNSDNATEVLINNNNGYEGAYYYIDNIELQECSVVNTDESIISSEIITINADNKNDLFYINSSFLNEINFSVEIFNRWGNSIFKSYDKGFIWDGKYQGRNCSSGTYFYLIQAQDKLNKNLTFKGYIQLIN